MQLANGAGWHILGDPNWNSCIRAEVLTFSALNTVKGQGPLSVASPLRTFHSTCLLLGISGFQGGEVVRDAVGNKGGKRKDILGRVIGGW